MRDRARKEKLKEIPEGFHITDGQYTCPICGYSITGDQTWYDKHGLKCIDCQGSVDKKILPGSVFKDKDSWYSVWEFDYYFKIKLPAVRKFVRQGKLKSRIVPNAQGGKHCEIFLIKDNAGVLPKKPKGFLVKDGDGRSHVEYESVDISGLTGEEGKKNRAVSPLKNRFSLSENALHQLANVSGQSLSIKNRPGSIVCGAVSSQTHFVSRMAIKILIAQ